MAFDRRRTKSLASLQHSSNTWSPLDDSDDDSDSDDGTDSQLTKTILTIDEHVTVRVLRRADAKAVHDVLGKSSTEDPLIFLLDTAYLQPFSLWQSHKLIDEALNEETQRRHNPVQETNISNDNSAYDRATRALALLNLDDRLSRGGNVSREPAEDSEPNHIETRYAIAYDDALIGMVEVSFEDPLLPTSDPNASSPISEDIADPSFLHRAELGYWLAAAYRSRGIATAVVRAFLDWTWRNFAQLERVDASIYTPWNAPSRRVLEKCGFRYEGTFQGGVRVRMNGDFGDVEWYAAFRPGGRLEQ